MNKQPRQHNTIPRYEQFIIGALLKHTYSNRVSAQKTVENYQSVTVKVSQFLGQKHQTDFTRQVLIPRPRGLEASSCNWSVFMTVQHLNIVTTVISGLIQNISRPELLSEVVIADVKPAADAGADEVLKYQENADHFLQLIADPTLLSQKQTHTHPWFGALTAKQWADLNTVHQLAHLKQIRKIIALSASGQ